MSRFVPVYCFLTEIGFICHMAGNSCVIAENSIFNYRLARFYRLEEIPHMRIKIIPVMTTIVHLIIKWFPSKFGGIFTIPFTLILSTHLMWKSTGVIAGDKVNAGLWCKTKVKFTRIQNTLWTHKPGQFRSLSSKT